MKDIKEKSDTYLDDVLAAWLKRQDNVDGVGLPTWPNLVKALRHPTVSQIGVANKIEKEVLAQSVTESDTQ